MCIVIAGLQPKTRTLDKNPRRCPICGLHQAYTRQVDHYISFFFIPLLRVKKGDPFLYCQRCEQAVWPDGGQDTPERSGLHKDVPTCNRCGRDMEHRFRYCPYCGQRQF